MTKIILELKTINALILQTLKCLIVLQITNVIKDFIQVLMIKICLGVIMEKVNIIIPIYNSEEYLFKCLDSIKNQTLKGIKAILVNDGSTDSSEKIIDEYVNTYPNIFEKINKENGGQATARNLGLEKATRRICYFHR